MLTVVCLSLNICSWRCFRRKYTRVWLLASCLSHVVWCMYVIHRTLYDVCTMYRLIWCFLLSSGKPIQCTNGRDDSMGWISYWHQLRTQVLIFASGKSEHSDLPNAQCRLLCHRRIVPAKVRVQASIEWYGTLLSFAVCVYSWLFGTLPRVPLL